MNPNYKGKAHNYIHGFRHKLIRPGIETKPDGSILQTDRSGMQHYIPAGAAGSTISGPRQKVPYWQNPDSDSNSSNFHQKKRFNPRHTQPNRHQSHNQGGFNQASHNNSMNHVTNGHHRSNQHQSQNNHRSNQAAISHDQTQNQPLINPNTDGTDSRNSNWGGSNSTDFSNYPLSNSVNSQSNPHNVQNKSLHHQQNQPVVTTAGFQNFTTPNVQAQLGAFGNFDPSQISTMTPGNYGNPVHSNGNLNFGNNSHQSQGHGGHNGHQPAGPGQHHHQANQQPATNMNMNGQSHQYNNQPQNHLGNPRPRHSFPRNQNHHSNSYSKFNNYQNQNPNDHSGNGGNGPRPRHKHHGHNRHNNPNQNQNQNQNHASNWQNNLPPQPHPHQTPGVSQAQAMAQNLAAHQSLAQNMDPNLSSGNLAQHQMDPNFMGHQGQGNYQIGHFKNFGKYSKQGWEQNI